MNEASSAAIRMSQAKASDAPAPAATPLIAPTIGCGEAAHRQDQRVVASPDLVRERQRVRLEPLAQVLAGTERPAGPGQDDRSDGRVAVDRAEGREERLLERDGQAFSASGRSRVIVATARRRLDAEIRGRHDRQAGVGQAREPRRAARRRARRRAGRPARRPRRSARRRSPRTGSRTRRRRVAARPATSRCRSGSPIEDAARRRRARSRASRARRAGGSAAASQPSPVSLEMRRRSPDTSSVQAALADHAARLPIAASWIAAGSTPHDRR